MTESIKRVDVTIQITDIPTQEVITKVRKERKKKKKNFRATQQFNHNNVINLLLFPFFNIQDNVSITIESVLYWRVLAPYEAEYRAEDLMTSLMER